MSNVSIHSTNFPTLLTNKPKKVRKLFTSEEDSRLISIMSSQTFSTWNAVSSQIPGRTARQCRDRWANYLSPTNKNTPWAENEDLLLLEKFNVFGPQWSKIAQFFDGRSDNNVKNRWNTHLKPISRFDPFSKQYVIDTNASDHGRVINQIVRPTPLVTHSRQYQIPQKFSMTPNYNDPIDKKKDYIILPPIETLNQNTNLEIPNFNQKNYVNSINYRYRSSSVQPASSISINSFLNL